MMFVKPIIGQLEQVELRKIWKKETDFSEWLAKRENLSLLGDELGIAISMDEGEIKTEAGVGDLRVDILAQEKESGQKIIIENQLNETDHDHLGKLITYAAYHKASRIIWVFPEIKEEHREAINWLNDKIGEKASFFAVKIEMLQIDGSELPAPKFQIVSKPSRWNERKKRKKIKKQQGKEFREQEQEEFRSNLAKNGSERRPDLFKESICESRWYDIKEFEFDKAWIALGVETTGKNKLVCRFHIQRDNNLLNYLKKHRTEIEREIGATLDWGGYYIDQVREDFDLNDEKKWDEHFNWLIERAGVFYDVFTKHIKGYEEQSKAGGNI